MKNHYLRKQRFFVLIAESITNTLDSRRRIALDQQQKIVARAEENEDNISRDLSVDNLE
jgi:hypothetical protein